MAEVSNPQSFLRKGSWSGQVEGLGAAGFCHVDYSAKEERQRAGLFVSLAEVPGQLHSDDMLGDNGVGHNQMQVQSGGSTHKGL
jgi:hypothetical protein